MKVAVVHLFIQSPENVTASVVDDVFLSQSECQWLSEISLASPKLQSGVLLSTRKHATLVSFDIWSQIMLPSHNYEISPSTILCQQHYIMVKGNNSCNVETAAPKKMSLLKNVLKFILIGGLFFFLVVFFSMSTQISLTSTCQQPNHQITYMQHIWNQMWASHHNNPNKTMDSSQAGGCNESK